MSIEVRYQRGPSKERARSDHGLLQNPEVATGAALRFGRSLIRRPAALPLRTAGRLRAVRCRTPCRCHRRRQTRRGCVRVRPGGQPILAARQGGQIRLYPAAFCTPPLPIIAILSNTLPAILRLSGLYADKSDNTTCLTMQTYLSVQIRHVVFATVPLYQQLADVFANPQVSSRLSFAPLWPKPCPSSQRSRWFAHGQIGQMAHPPVRARLLQFGCPSK